MATQASFLTLSAKSTLAVANVNQYRSGKYLNDENLIKVRRVVFKIIWLMPRVLKKEKEKDHRQSYPEPAQVSLGEKPKV